MASAAASAGVPQADPTLPAGALEVELIAAVDALKVEKPAQVYVGGARSSWQPGVPAQFKGLAAADRHQINVPQPYLAEPVNFSFPSPDQGALIAVRVMPIEPWAPPPEREETYMFEPLLEVDLTRQETIGIRWTQGLVTLAISELPRNAPDLESKLRREWEGHGYHRDPADMRLDLAVMRVDPRAPFGSILQVVQALLANRREQKDRSGGMTKVPAFALTITTPPVVKKLLLDDEIAPLDIVVTAPDRGSSIAAAAAPLRAAIARCAVAACSPALRARLHLHLGEALSAELDEGLAADAARVKRAEAELAFFEARAVDPGITLDSAATAGSGRLFAVAKKRRLPALKPGASSVSGRLSPESIQSGVAAREGLLRLCYVEALERDPKLAGRVAVRFVIGNDGVVAQAGNGGSVLPDPAAVRCFVETFKGLTFPRPQSGIVTVVYPYILSPDGTAK